MTLSLMYTLNRSILHTHSVLSVWYAFSSRCLVAARKKFSSTHVVASCLSSHTSQLPVETQLTLWPPSNNWSSLAYSSPAQPCKLLLVLASTFLVSSPIGTHDLIYITSKTVFVSRNGLGTGRIGNIVSMASLLCWCAG
jgi:hypothetical protein